MCGRADLLPHALRQGHTVRDVDDAALEALTQAYREAAGQKMSGPTDAR